MSKDKSGSIASMFIGFYVFKFSKENSFALPFLLFCTVLCAGDCRKEGLNHLLHRPCLRKNQETL